MRRTFNLGQSNEIIKSGHVYDLHNDLLPTAIIFYIQKGTLEVHFKSVSGNQLTKSFVLLFHEVDVLEFSGNFGAEGISGLDEIGYKDVRDYDYEWLSSETQSEATDHLVIRFDSGVTLRVHSKIADFLEDRTLTLLQPRAD